MYSTTDFRKGLKIEIDGTPFEIIEFRVVEEVVIIRDSSFQFFQALRKP